MLISSSELPTIQALASLIHTNPFTDDRIAIEKTALGSAFQSLHSNWNIRYGLDRISPNVTALDSLSKHWADNLLQRLNATQFKASPQELQLYEKTILNHLFNQFRSAFVEVITSPKPPSVGKFYNHFKSECRHYLGKLAGDTLLNLEYSHIFALFYQIHRAFHAVFDKLVGGSRATSSLRIAIWQSIFTHDMLRYYRTTYQFMQDIPTLISGPSGTGKELVARAIALSRYIPFDVEKKQFSVDFQQQFFPLQLSAMSENLIESELFGHTKGAYTGALSDRVGWFEQCSPYGTVFLDEIGEISPAIQVKLLRTLQSRSFQRLGDNEFRQFHGKIITATNRNLLNEIDTNQFRHDLYYRLCADIITTPSLAQQLENSDELFNLLLFIAQRLIGSQEAQSLAVEGLNWIEVNLPSDYPWKGNVRELEQCLRNILIRGSYNHQSTSINNSQDLFDSALNQQLSADDLLNYYCLSAHKKFGSYSEVSRLLGIDRRTAKSRILKAQNLSQEDH